VTNKSNDPPSFADMVEGVTKIENDRVNLYRDRTKPVAAVKIQPRFADSTTDFASIDYQQRSGIRDTQFNPGIQKKLQRKIRQGQLAIEDRLDLHGCTQKQAITALDEFLGHALRSEFRMLIIIHGRGSRSDSEAVLKPLVRDWLATQSSVLAWCPAQPKHGGDGACYVYLKSL